MNHHPLLSVARRLLLAAVVLTGALPAFGRGARFDAETFVLDMPCVAITSGGETASARYAVALQFNGEGFEISGLDAAASTDACTGNFDMDSGRLTDQVRYGDKVYDITLAFAGGNRFSLGGARFREYGQTTLWRVSDGENELFIGGTIHILHSSDYPLPVLFQEAYDMADLLVTEISLDDSEAIQDSGDAIDNPDGTLLSDTLAPATISAVNNFLAGYFTNISAIDTLSPVWAGQVLVSLRLLREGFGDGVDSYFMQRAREEGKLNLGLETADFQVGSINATGEGDDPDQIVLSALAAARSPAYIASLRAVISAWREGDMAVFDAALLEQKAASEDDYNIIIRDRNQSWVPQIEELLATGEVELVLVGAGHLAGEDSVLVLLEELGYTVERYH